MGEGYERWIIGSEDDHSTFIMYEIVKRLHLKINKTGMWHVRIFSVDFWSKLQSRAEFYKNENIKEVLMYTEGPTGSI